MNEHHHDHSQCGGHGHSHAQALPHSHHHGSVDMGRIFFICVLLNVGVIALELFFGFRANSLALIADAGHNVSDVMGLLLAWGALALSKRKPSGRYTYGLQSASIMAALINAILLLAAVAGISWQALMRFGAPVEVTTSTVILVAAISMILNGLTAMLLHKGHQHDLNIRGAYLHMVADAGISFGVVISAVIIMATSWLWVDPLMSILISLMIVVSGWRLLRDSVNLSLHAVPGSIDITQVKTHLSQQAGVAQVHDLHIWAMSTTSIALSAHLLMPGGHPGDDFLHTLHKGLQQHFGIDHATIQIETSTTAQGCELALHAD